MALLDTGVQANLPDIHAAVEGGADVAGGGGDGWTDNSAPLGHGTGMASLIAGQGVDGGVLGVAPEAKILPVVVSNPNTSVGAYTDATLAAGIRYAVGRGAQVINMSLGGSTTLASVCDDVQLQDALAYALQHNVVLVAAAGNDGQTATRQIRRRHVPGCWRSARSVPALRCGRRAKGSPTWR